MGRGGASARVRLRVAPADRGPSVEVLTKIKSRYDTVYETERHIDFELEGTSVKLVIAPRPWGTQLSVTSLGGVSPGAWKLVQAPYACVHESCGNAACLRCTLYAYLGTDLDAEERIRAKYRLEVGPRKVTVICQRRPEAATITHFARLTDDLIAWDRHESPRAEGERTDIHGDGVISICAYGTWVGDNAEAESAHRLIPEIATLPPILDEAAARALAAGRSVDVFDGEKSLRVRLHDGTLVLPCPHSPGTAGTVLVPARSACCPNCDPRHPHVELRAFMRRARDLAAQPRSVLDRVLRRV